MDPDEDDGVIHRRRESRRLRHLDPLNHSSTTQTLTEPLVPTPRTNVNLPVPDHITVEDASMSQYDTANTNDANTANSNILQSTKGSSNDPPEENHMSTSSLISYSHSTNSTNHSNVRNQENPNNIIQTVQQTNIPFPSNSTISSQTNNHQLYLLQQQIQTMQQDFEFFKQNTTENQNNINNQIQTLTTNTSKLAEASSLINTNLNEIKSSCTTNLEDVKTSLQHYENNLQSSITNAVVAALQQIQPPTTSNPPPIAPPTVVSSTNIPSPVPSSHPSTHASTTTSTTTQPTSNVHPSTVIDLTTLTNILQNHPPSSTKQILPTYHKKDNFYIWKSLCLLELSSSRNPFYNELVTYKENGGAIFKSDLSHQQNRELFKITRHALSTTLDTNFITTEIIQTADGLNLWKTLETRFKPLDKDEIEKIDFQTDFMKLKRNNNETHELFLTRFEKFISEMKYFNVCPSTLHQVLVFLDGLNEPLLCDPICTIRQSPQSIYANWIVQDNLKHTLQKAQNYLKQKRRYVKPAPNDRKQPKEKKQEATPSDRPNLEALKTNFLTSLKTETDPLNAIFDYRNKNRKGCYFHGNEHKFFKCRLAENVCENNGFGDAFNEAKRRSEVSTQNMLHERGIDPDNTPPTARRTTTTPSNHILSPGPNDQTLSPPIDDTESEQGFDSGSSYSNSVTNNIRVDPYSMSLPVSPICHQSNTNLIHQHDQHQIPTCRKSVTFHPSLTLPPKSTQKLELQAIPTISKEETCIPDSGCTHDMSNVKSLFEYIITLKTPSTAVLGDDMTHLSIMGYGMMNYMLNGKRIRRIGYYVPKLGTTLLSIKQHMKYQGCYFLATDNTVTLAFPTACVYPTVNNEFELHITPAKDTTQPYTFDETTAIPVITQKRRKYTILPKNMTPYITKETYSQHTASVRVKKLIPEATTPKRATEGSIGFDVRSISQATIPSNTTTLIGTGLAMAVPKGFYLRIADRSSLSTQGLTIKGGVVDNDYRGEVIVAMHNSTSQPVTIPAKSKIAQFIFEKAGIPCITITETLDTTQRGKGAFGSTSLATEKLIINRICMQQSVRQAKATYQSSIKIHDTNPNSETDEAFNVHFPNMKFLSKHRPPDPQDKPSIAETQTQSDAVTNSSVHAVHKLPIETVNKSIPKHISMNRDFISRATGFYNTENLLKHFNSLSQPTVSLSAIDKNPIMDEGEAATMPSKRRNTQPSTPPSKYSQIWHLDIGYGPTTSIGGFKYALLLVDKATRYKRMYPLKNLGSSILTAMKKFVNEVGITPTLIRTDFDYKLMGGEVEKILIDKNIRIEAAPPKRQHQNGLVERNWRSAVTMTRNWLRSAMLPAKYWWFALKRAVEISNIMPTKYGSNIATPHENLFGEKVDYRLLFPLFAPAYIKKETLQGGSHLNKFQSQSIKTICVGTCPRSDSLLFYHPHTKKVLSCADGYVFDMYSPAGPTFGESYDGTFNLNTKSSLHTIHMAPTHEKNKEIFVPSTRNPSSYHKATVLESPVDDDDPYTVQVATTGDIRQVHPDDIREDNPNYTPHDNELPANGLLPWIKHDSKVTIFLQRHFTTPKQGFLQHNPKCDTWTFIQGRYKSKQPIPLPNFRELCHSMALNKRLFQGWINNKTATTARYSRATSNLIAQMITARHISAKDLIMRKAPTSLLNHAKLHPSDRKIWDASYKEEYDGLATIGTWEIIDEDTYRKLKPLVGKMMPTMAIAVIKKDKQGNPIRAKYRIVALGNLDPRTWGKHDCFAPVLSQYELRILLSIAVNHNCVPKTGDVSQAFVQSCLPKQEQTVCKPPYGCPITPPNCYWKLRKTLYGLKRSPRHWFEKAKSILLNIGLKQCPNAPCIFFGKILPNQPPLYLGLYVDDFIYFSQSPQVEQHFETEFATHVPVTFEPEIDFFLGIRFDCTRDNRNNVSIHLTQEAFIESILTEHDLHNDIINCPTTPYRQGFTIDSIPSELYDDDTQRKLTHKLQSLVGCLNWLAISTRPDISTITNLLAKHCMKASKGHITAAKRVLRYLKGTKNFGIKFSSDSTEPINAFVKFPLPTSVTALADANWGPQDQSTPKPNQSYPDIELFKTRSLSGFILWHNGPIQWISKRQRLTARSSAEAEIVATDEATKSILYLRHILQDLQLHNTFMSDPTTIYNDNAACVCWSKSMTTKGLRHFQIRENAIRESVISKIIEIKHIEGKTNLADLFTKED